MIAQLCWRGVAACFILVALIFSGTSWAQSFEQGLEYLLDELEAASGPTEQAEVLDAMFDVRFERIADHDDRPHDPLTLVEKRYLVERLLPAVLIAGKSSDRFVRQRGLQLVYLVLDDCSSEFDLTSFPVEEVAMNAVLDANPDFEASATSGLRILYRYFSPSAHFTRMLLRWSVQADCSDGLAVRFFGAALGQIDSHPALIQDIDSMLVSVNGNRKVAFFSTLEYWLLKRGDARDLFETSFEDEVLACLDDTDSNVQMEAIRVLQQVGKRVGPSERAVDALVAVLLDRAQTIDVRLSVVRALQSNALYGNNSRGLAALALVACDVTENEELRVQTIGRFVFAQEDEAQLEALETSLDFENNPSMIRAFNHSLDYKAGKSSKSKGSAIAP